MDESEPRLRRRGMFFTVEPFELDDTEHDSAEGIAIRQVPNRRPSRPVRPISLSHAASPDPKRDPKGEGRAVRSANGTGSRQQARMSR